MKHLRSKLMTLLGLSMMLVGCGGDTSTDANTSAKGSNVSSSVVEEVKITRLVVTTQPNKVNYIAGEKFDPTGMIVTASYSNGTRKEITGYTWDKTGELTLDDSVVTISYEGVKTTVKIVMRDYDFRADKEDTYRVEIEDLDLKDLIVDGSGLHYEKNDFSSGGTSLGHIAYGELNVNFKVNDSYHLTATMYAAKYEETPISTYLKFSIDGKEATFEDTMLGRKKDGSNDWFNWQPSKVECGTLEKGSHQFKIMVIATVNLDCVDFTFTK